MKRYDISLVAEGLTAYAIERQNSFGRWQPPDKPPWAKSRRFWTDAILQGMVRLEGADPGPELMERFDQRLEDARSYSAAVMLFLAAQKELIRSLQGFISALEDAGGDRRRQVSVVKELLEDMATHPSRDSSANGVGLARGEAEGTLLRMTARMPIAFTRILLGGEMGPGGEDFVSGSVTDPDSVRSTELFAHLTQEHPEVAEWPAICTVYFGGGPAARAARPADELDLSIIRGEGTHFLDRADISLAGFHELRVPAREPIRVLKFEPGKAPEEITMPNTLEAFQEAVGGYIEAVGLDCGVCLLCNEEGKLDGLPANRRVNGDTIAGTFLIVGEADEEFCSLSDEDAAYYLERFADDILSYINQHLDTNLTIPVLASQFYMSSSHLSNIFKEETGTTVNHYITAKRIAHAKKLLAEGHLVAEVSSLCGYRDYSNFFKSFTRIVGISPKKYALYALASHGAEEV